MAKTFTEIAVRVTGNIAQLTASLNKASGDLKKFNSDINKIASAIGIGFGADKIREFGIEVLQLSGKAEGVSKAFDKLPNSTGLLIDLRTATQGTISDFELMQRTVQAFNLGIGLKEFPKLLEFATVRAQQTGEEIDYIVQSLVEGIGRKSVLKLDNLGISAERLRNKLGGVSMEAATIGQVTKAFGDIADEELKNMGGLVDTTATRIDRLKAAWTDFKIGFGGAIAPAAEPVIGYFTKLFKVINEADIGKLEKFALVLLGWRRSLVAIGKGELRTPVDVAYAQLLKDQAEKAEPAIRGAAAATAYFTEEFKKSKDATLATAKSFEILNLLIADNQSEIKKATKTGWTEYASKLKSTFKVLKDEWIKTTISLKKDAEANTIKDQATADANAIDNLIEKLKDYDRILRTFKISGIGQQFRLIADVKTGKVFKEELPKQSGENALTRLGLNKSEGVKSVEDLFGKNIADGIDSIVKKANEGVAAMEKMKAAVQANNEEFSAIATQGITDFLVGLGDVAAGTVSFGDNILRAVSGFMKAFGQQLIKIGIGKIGFDNLFKGPLGGPAAIAAGVALVAAAGAVSRNMQAKVRGVGSGWGGGAMSGNSGFPTGFNAGNQNITITGRLVGSGRDLVAVIDNTYFDNSMRKGG